MAKVQPRTYNVDLTTARSILQYVIDPGFRIASIYVAKLPSATILMALDAKYPFQIYEGMGMTFGECNWIEDGISIESPALPGQSLQLVIVPFIEGGALTVGSST